MFIVIMSQKVTLHYMTYAIFAAPIEQLCVLHFYACNIAFIPVQDMEQVLASNSFNHPLTHWPRF